MRHLCMDDTCGSQGQAVQAWLNSGGYTDKEMSETDAEISRAH